MPLLSYLNYIFQAVPAEFRGFIQYFIHRFLYKILVPILHCNDRIGSFLNDLNKRLIHKDICPVNSGKCNHNRILSADRGINSGC